MDATWTVRDLYVRGIAGIHAIAVLSYRVQCDLLVGDAGMRPVSRWLPGLAEHLGHRPLWSVPTLLWAWPTERGVHALCDVGIALALALALGFPWQGPALVVLWAVYLSLVTVSGDFLMFQWDSLLLEATFAAAFVARWRRGGGEPPAWAWAVQGWLLARLMFFGGLVKLTSGDPHWADGTALDYHFWTQPLPNPVSRWAHHWPQWLHALGVGFTFVVELFAPFLIPLGRVPRRIAFGGFVALMGMLAFTGNYGFFQLLSVVLCLPLLREPAPASPGWRPHVGAPLAALWFALSLLWIPGYRALPAAGQAALEWAYPFHTVNPYGLFAVMTTDRVEIVFEGKWGDRWRELPLRYKPGPLDRTPPQVAPHMPRLDWQLWFAALGSCDDNRWVLRFMQLVAGGSEPALDAFAPGTFPDGPPERVRALAYRYVFTPSGSAEPWAREPVGAYCVDQVGAAPNAR